jgi:(E)-4-hydroxy-3-methylbut-2-enyl-diphosphate synthase
MKRHKTKEITIGKVKIGGNNTVAIQSMAKTKSSDIDATVSQIIRLQKAGCEIIRVAVKDFDDAIAIRLIKKSIAIPLVADIHFNFRLALAAIENGADKIRLNPGNIYKKGQIKEVVSAAKNAHIPIRVGLNSGSVRGSKDPVKNMVESALSYIEILESLKFYDIVVSLKASTAIETLQTYRHMADKCGYPLHLGVTATGLPAEGIIKSSVAIGALLLDGIGDTIRISLTDKPEQEILAAKILLKSLGLRDFGPEIISCPTCGRCEVDLVSVVKELEKKLSVVHGPCLAGRTCLTAVRQVQSTVHGNLKPLKVAVMGCVVNGPGEARHADIGIAFGKNEGLLFKKGKPVYKVSVDRCVDVLIDEIKNYR